MNPVEVLSSRPSAGFVDEWYDMAGAGHFWMRWRLAAFLRQVRDLGVPTREPWTGLDVGCGTGVACLQLERGTAWTVDGTDMNQPALSLHERRRGRTYFYDIHDRRPEFAGRYDFVVLFDVLEHIPDPDRFLESTLFHLKKGGWLFINVPALESLRSHYDTAAGHLRRYDLKMMKDALAPHGLGIRDMRYWGASMIPLLVVRKLLLRGGTPDDETIRRGFQPPHPSLNWCLRGLCRAETSLWARPPLGTSLLAAAVKA